MLSLWDGEILLTLGDDFNPGEHPHIKPVRPVKRLSLPPG